MLSHTIQSTDTISENWRYAHPEHANVVVVTTNESGFGTVGSRRVQAIVAEDRGRGDRIFLKSHVTESQEQALRDLLERVTNLVRIVVKDTPVSPLNVKSLNQNEFKIKDHGDASGKEVKKPQQSPKDEELKVSHNLYHALCDVINLRFQKLAR